MAQRTVVRLVDDIEGTELANGKGETVSFALDGVSYEIDLADKNAKKLRDALQFYVEHGRRVAGRRGRSTSGAASRPAKDYDTAAVKAWAATKKIDVPSRGRLPKSLIDQYKAAGN